MGFFQAVKTAACACVGLMMAVPAVAADYWVRGGGTWDSATTASAITAADTAFAFEFMIDPTLPANPTNAVSNFRYTLGGSDAAVTLGDVTFYTQGSGGGLQLQFGSGALLAGWGTSLLGSDGRLALLGNGPLDFAADDAGGSGWVTVTEAAAAVVPEPASWALMILGFGLAGAALRRRSVATAMVRDAA